MTEALTPVDPFDLPDWLGVAEVTWSALGGLRTGYAVPGELLADALGQQDIGAPAQSGAQRVTHSERVESARPRLGQQQHADGGEARPDEPVTTGAAQHGDTERPEELQRAGGTQRDAFHRHHEQHGDARGHDTEQHGRDERGAGE